VCGPASVKSTAGTGSLAGLPRFRKGPRRLPPPLPVGKHQGIGVYFEIAENQPELKRFYRLKEDRFRGQLN
jgi:hypothetical protein